MRECCPVCGAREGDGLVLADCMTGGMRQICGNMDYCVACGWENRDDVLPTPVAVLSTEFYDIASSALNDGILDDAVEKTDRLSGDV